MLPFLLPALILIVSGIALLQRDFLLKHTFYPYRIRLHNDVMPFFTYWLVHNGLRHLLGNLAVLIVLLLYASQQDVLPVYILIFLAGCLLSPLLPYLRKRHNSKYMAVGASGGIYALLAAALWSNIGQSIPWFTVAIPVWVVFAAVKIKITADLFKKSQSATDIHACGFAIGFLLASGL